MRRFLFVNLEIYTYLCKKLSYTPCYKYVLFLFYLIKKLNYEKEEKSRVFNSYGV
jgi:hypothetical protein